MPNIKNKPVIDVTGINEHYSETVASLNYFLKDVRGVEPLTREEEKELFRRIKAGDEKAKAELIEAHQLFVLAVAKRYSSNDNIMDLVQVGNIGMIQAIDNYNPNKKGPEGKPIRFLSYAAWYIRREITFYIVNNGFIRKTNNVKTIYKLNRIKNNFYLHNGRYPSMDELKTIIEDEYGIKIKDYSYLYDIETKYIGATYDGADKKDTFENSALFNEKSASMNEYDDKIEYEYNKSLVDDMLKDLTKRECDIVKRLYGIGYDREFTMDEVSEMYGMTRERVRQIKNASVKKLKKLYVHASNK